MTQIWAPILLSYFCANPKSDERILGESDFVADVLSSANEKFDRKYELKRLGYDLDRIATRVAEIY